MITIDDILEYCIDEGMLTVSIWDIDSEEEVYVGPGDEIPDDLRYTELNSWDVPIRSGHITFNI